MFDDLKDIIARQAPTLVQDLAGITALGFMLMAGLVLPSLF
ncbi:hypothetical protein [Acidimangrovimonas sediminis]|nr:hypothetical protein [Acidimangrovimonas sediminis]